MPLGTEHHEVGLLLRGPIEPILRKDGGGEWRLDLGFRANWRTRHWYGRRVKVYGVRSGFDLLNVKAIELA